MTIQGGVTALFAYGPGVFVTDDLPRYSVEGSNILRAASDVVVVVVFVATAGPPGFPHAMAGRWTGAVGSLRYYRSTTSWSR